MNEMIQRTSLLFLFANACVPDFGTGNQDLTILGVASSTLAACQFDTGMPPVIGDAIVLDLASSDSLRLPIVVRNDSNDPIAFKNIDLRFECDVAGFSAGVGPLYVPSFSSAQPFCLDSRLETSNFVGFDVLELSGAPLSSGDTGVVWAQIIPDMLGRGIEQTIDLGLRADACVEEDRLDDCPEFDELYLDLAGSSSAEDLLRYAPFAFMDGSHELAEQTTPRPLSSGLRLQVRAILRAENNRHDGVFSNELIHVIELCRNCGEVVPGTPPTRAARTGFECYYDPTIPR